MKQKYPVLLYLMIALPCSIETVFQFSDIGLIAVSNLRQIVYQNGAFWIGLLSSWTPNYPLQPLTMFFSYALLHAGLMHLTGNMVALYFLGRQSILQFGVVLFLLIYTASAVGGGAGFALLSSTAQPMIGASGALFGLMGALLGYEYLICGRLGISRNSVILKSGGLAVLNVLSWFFEDGLLAWQAHLGGFITGWIVIISAENIKIIRY